MGTSSRGVKGLVHSSVTNDGAKETRLSIEESEESDSEDVEEVQTESSSEYDELRRSSVSKHEDLFGRLTTTNSSSSEDIDVVSHGDDSHDGLRVRTVISASRSTLIVMVSSRNYFLALRINYRIYVCDRNSQTSGLANSVDPGE